MLDVTSFYTFDPRDSQDADAEAKRLSWNPNTQGKKIKKKDVEIQRVKSFGTVKDNFEQDKDLLNPDRWDLLQDLNNLGISSRLPVFFSNLYKFIMRSPHFQQHRYKKRRQSLKSPCLPMKSLRGKFEQQKQKMGGHDFMEEEEEEEEEESQPVKPKRPRKGGK